MRTIKQPPNSHVCMAACCAMITGKSLKYVLQNCELSPQSHMSVAEAWKFLHSEGFWYGWNGDLEDDVNLEDDDTDFVVSYNVLKLDAPAIIGVRSWVSENGLHAVVWDPEFKAIRDPSPSVKRLTTPSDYSIVSWSIIMETDTESGTLLCEACSGLRTSCTPETCNKARLAREVISHLL